MSPTVKKTVNDIDSHSIRLDMKLQSNKMATLAKVHADDSQKVHIIKDIETETAVMIDGGTVSITY